MGWHEYWHASAHAPTIAHALLRATILGTLCRPFYYYKNNISLVLKQGIRKLGGLEGSRVSRDGVRDAVSCHFY